MKARLEALGGVDVSATGSGVVPEMASVPCSGSGNTLSSRQRDFSVCLSLHLHQLLQAPDIYFDGPHLNKAHTRFRRGLVLIACSAPLTFAALALGPETELDGPPRRSLSLVKSPSQVSKTEAEQHFCCDFA